MLTIFVSRRKQRIITADGSKMKVRRAYVRQGKKLRFLQEPESFQNISSVRVVVKEWCKLRRLPRHERTEKGIIRFLHEHHAKQNIKFDCYAFANLVQEIEAHPCCYLYRNWDTKPYRGEVGVGDTVFLVTPGEEMSNFHHAAIYIGRGLYISVYGAGGDLEITTLQDMKKFYKAKCVLVGTPKT
jgi:hypothetical protein